MIRGLHQKQLAPFSQGANKSTKLFNRFSSAWQSTYPMNECDLPKSRTCKGLCLDRLLAFAEC
jgi:hypothetical protein